MLPWWDLPATDYTIINSTKNKNKGLAFYGQLQYDLSKSFTLAGGLRYDYQESSAECFGRVPARRFNQWISDTGGYQRENQFSCAQSHVVVNFSSERPRPYLYQL